MESIWILYPGGDGDRKPACTDYEGLYLYGKTTES
jgi:hypothetical protein